MRVPSTFVPLESPTNAFFAAMNGSGIVRRMLVQDVAKTGVTAAEGSTVDFQDLTIERVHPSPDGQGRGIQ
ncbi:MAG: hypothetical protein GWN73_32695, partial [Actinobacteria bacterium]|nr:hypothetical protein [Actinomycetota bacterium]NIU69885.1 hypothetical protein [Actinomycetota bacterium]NIW31765.1 hypothetical protein [Actinomycetota bacterium]